MTNRKHINDDTMCVDPKPSVRGNTCYNCLQPKAARPGDLCAECEKDPIGRLPPFNATPHTTHHADCGCTPEQRAELTRTSVGIAARLPQTFHLPMWGCYFNGEATPRAIFWTSGTANDYADKQPAHVDVYAVTIDGVRR